MAKIATPKRIIDFLNDNIGTDVDANSLLKFVTDNAIEGDSNQILSRAFDEMKKLEIIERAPLKDAVKEIDKNIRKAGQQYAYIRDIPDEATKTQAYVDRARRAKEAGVNVDKLIFWADHSEPPMPSKKAIDAIIRADTPKPSAPGTVSITAPNVEAPTVTKSDNFTMPEDTVKYEAPELTIAKDRLLAYKQRLDDTFGVVNTAEADVLALTPEVKAQRSREEALKAYFADIPGNIKVKGGGNSYVLNGVADYAVKPNPTPKNEFFNRNNAPGRAAMPEATKPPKWVSFAVGTTMVTGGLVLALSDRRGQQSNAQLYGQQPLY